MKPIYFTMAAIAALSLAAPAAAEMRDRTYSHELRLQIETGISQGTISRNERVDLRAGLRDLIRLEQRYSPNGISGREHAVLKQRSTALTQDIRRASRSTNWGGREISAHQAGGSADNYIRDYRFAAPFPGDRYSGDVKVGQRITGRIAELPARYRNEYVDNERIYYGYDKGRVYQIDRHSQLILALLDIRPSQR